MVGKLECAAADDAIDTGTQAPANGHMDAEVRPINVMLSGTVLVDYDVTIRDVDGTVRTIVVRIEFPDEVRSMLEASTWGRGVTILEAISRLGATFVEQNAASGLLRFTKWEHADGLAFRPPTFHIPLSYVRSSLTNVFATAV
jgi:hypothetical protein